MIDVVAVLLALAVGLVVGLGLGMRREHSRVEAIFSVAMCVVVSPTISALYARFAEFFDDDALRNELRKIVAEKEARRRIRDGSASE